jgi:hypothetical protein
MTDNIKPRWFPVKWSIFPVAELAKFPPLIKDPLNAASNDPTQIATWRKQWPRCNWAVSPRKTNLLTVDVDLKPGSKGRWTYDCLDLEYGFPPTFTVRTPSGGFHRYYRGRHVFALGKNGFGPGVDSANYTLLPGSHVATPIPGGKIGTYRDGVYRAVNNLPIATAPSWFYEVLGQRRAAADPSSQIPLVDLDKPHNIERAVHFLKTGARICRQGDGGEKTLFDTSCVLKDMGISEWQAGQLLIEHYNDRCEPPWQVGDCADSDNLLIKVHNAFAYGVENAPGCDTAEADFAGDAPEDVDALADSWKLFDRDWRILHNFTSIDDKVVRVDRPPTRK